MSTSVLTQPLMEMKMGKTEAFLTILGLNVEGLNDAKCDEIRNAVEIAGCNFLALCETGQEPLNAILNPESVIQYNRLNSLFPESEWGRQFTPCPCPRTRYFTGHGIALYWKKENVRCNNIQAVHINSLDGDDHRQIACTLTNANGENVSHLIFVHYKSGIEGMGAKGNAFKRLQFRASAYELDCREKIRKKNWKKRNRERCHLICMGDMNADPRWPIHNEIDHIFEKL